MDTNLNNVTPLHRIARAVRLALNSRPSETRRFVVDGMTYSTGEMLDANAHDEAVCDWVRTAVPGDTFPGFVECQCVALS